MDKNGAPRLGEFRSIEIASFGISDQFSCFFRPAERAALMDTVAFAHTAAFRGLGPEGQLTSQIFLPALASTPPEYLLSCCKAHAPISFGTFCATKVAGGSSPHLSQVVAVNLQP